MYTSYGVKLCRCRFTAHPHAVILANLDAVVLKKVERSPSARTYSSMSLALQNARPYCSNRVAAHNLGMLNLALHVHTMRLRCALRLSLSHAFHAIPTSLRTDACDVHVGYDDELCFAGARVDSKV